MRNPFVYVSLAFFFAACRGGGGTEDGSLVSLDCLWNATSPWPENPWPMWRP